MSFFSYCPSLKIREKGPQIIIKSLETKEDVQEIVTHYISHLKKRKINIDESHFHWAIQVFADLHENPPADEVILQITTIKQSIEAAKRNIFSILIVTAKKQQPNVTYSDSNCLKIRLGLL